MCLHCTVFICVLTAQPSMRSEMGLIYIVGTHKNGVIADQQTYGGQHEDCKCPFVHFYMILVF